jgi:hypothetical protein
MLPSFLPRPFFLVIFKSSTPRSQIYRGRPVPSTAKLSVENFLTRPYGLRAVVVVAASSLSGGLVERSKLPEVTHVHRGTVLDQQLSYLDNILHSTGLYFSVLYLIPSNFAADFNPLFGTMLQQLILTLPTPHIS